MSSHLSLEYCDFYRDPFFSLNNLNKGKASLRLGPCGVSEPVSYVSCGLHVSFQTHISDVAKLGHPQASCYDQTHYGYWGWQGLCCLQAAGLRVPF